MDSTSPPCLKIFTVDSPALCGRLVVRRSLTETEQKRALQDRGEATDDWQAISDRAAAALRHEAAIIARLKTDAPGVPVPTVVAAFEDVGCFWLIQEVVPDCVLASNLPHDCLEVLAAELDRIMMLLHGVDCSGLVPVCQGHLGGDETASDVGGTTVHHAGE